MTWRDVCKRKPDWELLLVFSDYLEDQGDLRSAEALRHLVLYRHWPTHRPGSSNFTVQKGRNKSWDWTNAAFVSGTSFLSTSRSLLSEEWLGDSRFVEHATVEEAIRWYIERYHELKKEGRL